MLMAAYRVDSRVTAALHSAVAAAERQHEISIILRTPKDLDTARKDAESAAFLFLDMRLMDIRAVLSLAADTLQANPFAKITVISAAQLKLEDQIAFFDLGRLGVTALPLPEMSERASWWTDFFDHHIVFDVVTAAQQTIAAMIPPGERGALLLRITQLAHVTSVKRLADRLYATDKHTTVYKRRRLWEECRRLQLGTPEAVLAAARLQLLKLILDADQWTPTRVARYFGADTARNFSRSCKTRYGWSLRHIRTASREEVLEKVKAVYRADAPWTIDISE